MAGEGQRELHPDGICGITRHPVGRHGRELPGLVLTDYFIQIIIACGITQIADGLQFFQL